MGERLLRHNAGVIDEKLCRKIIGAVDHEIIVFHEIHDILAGDECPIRIDLDIRIDCFHGLLSGLYLCLAHICGCVDDLALEVGKVYFVSICNADGTHAGCCQIHCCRSTQAACTNDQHFRIEQLLLSLDANLFQDDVTGVALDLFVGKCHLTVHLP